MKKLILIMMLALTPYTASAEWSRNPFFAKHRHHNHDYEFWHHVDQRLNRQYARIERGIDKGDLTRREARRLHRAHQELDRTIDHKRRKRRLSDHDRNEIMSCLDQASEKIYRLKNNDRYRHYAGRHYHNKTDHFENRVVWSNRDRYNSIYLRF